MQLLRILCLVLAARAEYDYLPYGSPWLYPYPPTHPTKSAWHPVPGPYGDVHTIPGFTQQQIVHIHEAGPPEVAHGDSYQEGKDYSIHNIFANVASPLDDLEEVASSRVENRKPRPKETVKRRKGSATKRRRPQNRQKMQKRRPQQKQHLRRRIAPQRKARPTRRTHPRRPYHNRRRHGNRNKNKNPPRYDYYDYNDYYYYYGDNYYDDYYNYYDDYYYAYDEYDESTTEEPTTTEETTELETTTATVTETTTAAATTESTPATIATTTINGFIDGYGPSNGNENISITYPPHQEPFNFWYGPPAVPDLFHSKNYFLNGGFFNNE